MYVPSKNWKQFRIPSDYTTNLHWDQPRTKVSRSVPSLVQPISVARFDRCLDRCFFASERVDRAGQFFGQPNKGLEGRKVERAFLCGAWAKPEEFILPWSKMETTLPDNTKGCGVGRTCLESQRGSSPDLPFVYVAKRLACPVNFGPHLQEAKQMNVSAVGEVVELSNTCWALPIS